MDDRPGEVYHRQIARRCLLCHAVTLPDQGLKPEQKFHGVGCESCHGPGSEHIRAPQSRAATIVNPAKLDFVRANDTCIQCHSQGKPLKTPLDER